MNCLIVDDNPLWRTVVRILFECDPAFQICGEAKNVEEGLCEAIALRPDLIIIDLAMPMVNGLNITRAINRIMPKVAVILFSAHTEAVEPKELLSSGISALVSKSEPWMLLDVAHDLLRQNAA